MLELKNIKKDYLAGDNTVHALKGVSLKFRKSEFVSILGQSGCGKTTLLNIVGGLDRYTSGDLVIGGVSMSGGKGTLWGTFIGIVLVGCLRNALNLLGMNPYWQGTALGVVIIVAVLAERLATTSKRS